LPAGVKVISNHRLNKSAREKIHVSFRKTKSAAMQLKNFLILLSCTAVLASCKNGLLGKKKERIFRRYRLELQR